MKNDYRKFPEWDSLPKSLDNELRIAIRELDASKTRLNIKRKEKQDFDKEIKGKWKDLEHKMNELKNDNLNYKQLSLVILIL